MKLWGRSVCNPLGVCRRIVSELKPRTLSDGSSRRWVSVDSAGRDPVSNIRNVGVMAHIDAGKTTTTERMLFYAGFTKHMGDVDDGDTVMDFMEQERERGITINSAAISFEWLQHQINLIDTPGHVDFTFEVERSLRVLDGAVVVFDGSAGVETQSVTVWRQACHYKIPRVAFVNKMDKPGTSLSLTVESMKQKLDAVPLITQLPLGQGKDFTGVIDLLSMDILVWERGSDGSEFTRIPLLKINQDTGVRDFGSIGMLLGPNLNFADLPVSRERIKDALDHRSMLAEQVVSMDDVLIERVSDDLFDPLTLTHDDLITGIRRLTTSCSATPLLCGSSLHNVGVQPLMDAILAYLPGPLERPLPIPEALKGLYAYAFKVMHDKRRGPMVFLRIYSGQIEPHTTVHNISRNTDERVSRVLLMLADEQREVGQMEEGKIAVAVGMKNTYTGDTIVRSGSAARSAERELVRHGIDPHQEASGIHILGKISVPPPVFFCSVEPATAAIQKDLDHALSCLAREDPSLRVSVNQDTGQTVLSGMGELHLEVVHDRLRRDYRLDCSLGKLQVAYKECPTIPVSHKALLDRSFGSKRHQVSLTLNFSPNQDLSKSSEDLIVHLDLTRQQQEMLPGGFTKAELITAIREGVETACLQGPLLGYPVVHLSVSVSDLTIGPTTSLAMLSACISEGMVKGLQEAEVELLEPCTHLVVTVPEEYMGKVLGDLSSHRRAHIQELGAQEAQGKERVITAITPLAGLMGYSTALRTMTSGTATFVSTFSHYEPVSKDQEKLIMQELRGYIY